MQGSLVGISAADPTNSYGPYPTVVITVYIVGLCPTRKVEVIQVINAFYSAVQLHFQQVYTRRPCSSYCTNILLSKH
jgi:hypothetical protein